MLPRAPAVPVEGSKSKDMIDFMDARAGFVLRVLVQRAERKGHSLKSKDHCGVIDCGLRISD